MENILYQKKYNWDTRTTTEKQGALIGEEPLSIRIQGHPYSVIMRTPGDEIPQVAGFCLGEGLVDSPEDIKSLAFCDGTDTNVVAVTLTEKRRRSIPDLLGRRQYVSQTSCGLCGKEIVEDLYVEIQPFEDETIIDIRHAYDCINSLSTLQPLREKTRTSHAAAIYDAGMKLLSIAEDVGRHSALDKAIGNLFLDRRLNEGTVLLLSSRISYELVQKAARARIPIILAVSRPTALAVMLAEKLNMTLICLSKNVGLDIYCGIHRINTED